MNLGWILKISGDWTKGEWMSEMHEKKQPVSKTEVRDVSRKTEYETKTASKEKENKRERSSGLVCVCVRASYRCAARCDRRGPKGLRRAWSLAGFVPSLPLRAGSLPAPSLSPALSPVRVLQTTHTPPFPSAPAQRNASLHATQTHTHTAQSWNQIQCYEHQQ